MTTGSRIYNEKIDKIVLSNLDEIDKALSKIQFDFTNNNLEEYKPQRIYYMYAFNKRLKRMLKIFEQYYLLSNHKFKPYTDDVKYKMENMCNVLKFLNDFTKSQLREKHYNLHRY